MLRTVVPLAVLVTALGCDENRSSTPPVASAQASAAAPASDCPKQSEALGSWLTQAADEGPGPPPGVKALGANLVKTNAGKAWPWFGAALVVTDKRRQLDLEDPVAPDDAGNKALESSLKSRVQTAIGAGMAPRLDLFVDAKTPWKDVVWASNAAANAGIRTQGFAFSAAGKAAEAPPAPLVAKLRAAAPKRELTDTPPLVEEQKAEQRLLPECAAAQPVLSALADESLSLREKTQQYAKRMVAAFKSCGCKPSADEFKAVLWYWLDRDNGPAVTSIETRVAAAKDPDAVVVAIKGDTPWQTAHAALLAAVKDDKALRLEEK